MLSYFCHTYHYQVYAYNEHTLGGLACLICAAAFLLPQQITHWSMLESLRLVCFVKATPLPLLFLFITCTGRTTYYVKSTPNTSCPVHLCLTLSEYAQQPHIYGTSNTTLLLLPGDHVLTVNFTVEDTTDFTICAKVSSHIENRAVTVVCQGMVGLMFRNIFHMLHSRV